MKTHTQPNHGLKVRVTRSFTTEFLEGTEHEAMRLRMPHNLFLELLWAYWRSEQGKLPKAKARSRAERFRDKVERV